MYPFLRPGDRLIVQPLSPDALQVGDIVVSRNHLGHPVAHRLVRRLPGAMGITKGDSLLAPDSDRVDLATVLGRVEAVLRGGRRWIPVSTGFRARVKRFYTLLSLKGMTYGALKLRIKARLRTLGPKGPLKDPSRERTFLLRALKDDPLNQGSHGNDPALHWPRVRETARSQGLAGLLFTRLDRSELRPRAGRGLEQDYRKTAARNLIHLTALEKLEEHLNREEIHVLALKGISLLDRVYPGLGMRPMVDMDLMIHPEDRQRFEGMLLGLGYLPDPAFPHIFRKGGVAVDLHIHALNADRIRARRALFPTGMDPLWTRAMPWKPGFRFLRRPDDVDNVLLLVQHLMKHSFSRLIWIMDVYLILRAHGDSFQAGLARRAVFLGQWRPLCYALYLLDGLLAFRPSDPRLKGLFTRISPLERGLLDLVVGGHTGYPVGPILAFLCIRGTGPRLRYAWETLLPRREVVKREFNRDSGTSLPLFIRIRLSQGTGLLLAFSKALIGAPGRRGDLTSRLKGF